MVVDFTPETESRLQALAAETGRAAADILEDALAGYLQERSELSELIQCRYDDVKSGRVQPIDGDKALAQLRQRSQERSAGAR